MAYLSPGETPSDNCMENFGSLTTAVMVVSTCPVKRLVSGLTRFGERIVCVLRMVVLDSERRSINESDARKERCQSEQRSYKMHDESTEKDGMLLAKEKMERNYVRLG